MIHTLTYGEKAIDYTVERKDRKAVRISIYPDQSIKVVAPKKIPLDKIIEGVNRRARWVFKNIEYFKSLPPKEPPRQYVSGETYMYLGGQYRLNVFQGQNIGVELKGKFLTLTATDKNNLVDKKTLLLRWYKSKAADKYIEILDNTLEFIKKYEIKKPRLKVRKLKSRWGSCSTKTNTIMLNLGLIKAPLHCIEYVVMHEVCHLKHPSHSKKFYDFLTKVMPDWKNRKKRLERVVI